MPTDAVVIGGGLVGLSCALNLQLNGVHTTLVDPVTTRRSASWGNAGHLATEQVEPLASRKTLRSFPRQALHAARLALVHPQSQTSIEWRAPLPRDMKSLLRVLREDARAGQNRA